ncbi:uncharacterized protein LOC105223375 isoform X1 [Bactrocera dorsalis]|uniref:Regulatory protein zeste n=2 Tax=Bactrocera dorsalis TaxID=27457 RepID=A0ABM3JYF9_BACDO|nr:uncharacterized protein LOC105223375 isoform X1 [Bactrocera dorsalis]XP_049314264.1 uncharacterized protein LOC105223375 isoform X1 [Bactrocera dorsalis]XP_049314271.1 uncharacterized protein LOC105223375 isoform X1 [Bactrocera dorsalis]
MRMTHKQKRNRLPNFTPAEESFLLSLAHKYVNVIESKLTDAQIWEEKRKAWENIDIEFGNKFGFRRGSKNLREKYDNLKRKLRRMESKDRNDDEQTFQKLLFDENIEKLSAIVGFSADCSSNDVENNDTFETDPEMNNSFNATSQSSNFDDPIQDSETVQKESENKWLSSNSNHSAQTRKITPSRRPDRKPCYNVNNLRSAEKHRWDCKRNKREAEKHRWEFEKHKLIVEKQKWELKEARLKTKLLQMKLKNSIPRDDSKSCISTISEDYFQTKPQSLIRMQDKTNAQSVDEAQNLISVATLSTNVKVEPTLDIMDIGNNCTNNSNENCGVETKTDNEELGGMCKRIKTIPSVSSDEQKQWELALKHDMPDTSNGAHSSFLDPIQLVETNIISCIGDDDDNEDDGCQTSEESIPSDATTDDQTKVSKHEHDFLKLLNKHRLQHYWAKLKDMNIGLDYLQYIEEVDVRDICGRDIGARIRFRALLVDWRTIHSLSETITSPIAVLKEAKRVIAELKAIIKQAPFVKDQNSTITSKESQCSQHTNYKKVLPETPFQSVLDFKVFEELIKNSEEAYQNLITELTAQHIYNSVNFLKASWRRIMSDHVAQHFCWTGTLEKPAIRTLSVTKALKEAYQRKFDFCTNDDFQRTIQPFFQHAKTRLQKKQNYEKLKAANITL